VPFQFDVQKCSSQIRTAPARCAFSIVGIKIRLTCYDSVIAFLHIMVELRPQLNFVPLLVMA
jgi:hypothetical protein